MKPSLLFAHGAGLGQNSSWMQHWKSLLERIGRVHCFDYPYKALGKSRPDPLPRLIECHRRELQAVRAGSVAPLVLIGKSMGSRVGCHVALVEPVAAVVCLGYPLQGMGRADKLRDQVLLDLTVPVLFVQGTRDGLCPLETLGQVRARMRARNELHVVGSGDHSLLATKTELKAQGLTQDDVDQSIVRAIDAFIVSIAAA